MAKKKTSKGDAGKSAAVVVDELAELVQRLHVPDGFLDDELYDTCDSDAKLAYENIRTQSIEKQLEFLYVRGYQPGRLEELIRAASQEA